MSDFIDLAVIRDYLKKEEKMMEAQTYLLTEILHELRRIQHRLDVPIKEKKEPTDSSTKLP